MPAPDREPLGHAGGTTAPSGPSERLPPPLWDDGPADPGQEPGCAAGEYQGAALSAPDDDGPADTGRYRPGCLRCERTRCPVRRHDPGDPYWSQCWHDHDRADGHALGDHRDCLPGDAMPLPDVDPHGEHHDHEDGPDACRWAARWRDQAAALAAPPAIRPLAVVALTEATGARMVGSHASYRTAGPHRTAVGKRPGDLGTGWAKARAVVVCEHGHLH
jgi:hypothetical protein